MMRHSAGLGWKRDTPDPRDWRVADPEPGAALSFPATFSLRDQCPPVWMQLHTSSCTAHGVAAAVAVELAKQGTPMPAPSRLFAYYNGRRIEGDTNHDNGAQIRDVMTGVATWGICDETCWPFNPLKVNTLPDSGCYKSGLLDLALQYQRVGQDELSIKRALYSGHLVVYGKVVFASFESPGVEASGIIPLPGPNETIVGAHCEAIVGWTNTGPDGTLYYEERNSYGPEWGRAGYDLIPARYVHSPQLADDFWQVDLIGPEPTLPVAA